MHLWRPGGKAKNRGWDFHFFCSAKSNGLAQCRNKEKATEMYCSEHVHPVSCLGLLFPVQAAGMSPLRLGGNCRGSQDWGALA